MKSKTDAVMASVDLREPWIWSLLCVLFIPVFPEYIMPILAFFALLFAKKDAKRRYQRLRVGKAGKVFLAFLCYMTIHTFWSSAAVDGLMPLVYWYAALLVYLAAVTILTSRERLETALFLLSLVVGLLGLLSIVQYVCGMLGVEWMPVQVWDTVDEAVYRFLGMEVNLHTVGLRPAATFSNPNLFAQFLLMAMPFAAAFSFSGQRTAAKVVGRLGVVCGVGGLCLTFSRGAFLAIGAIAVVMCIANIRRLVPILMVLMSVIMLLPDSIYARLSSMGNAADIAIIERFDVWGVTMEAFLQRPVTGHGFGYMWSALVQNGFSAPHAHNLFLHFLAEAGLVGLILLLFLMWKLFRAGFELIIHAPKTRMYGAAVIAFVAGVCVCGMVDYPLATPKPLAMFVTALAATDAMSVFEMKHASSSVGRALPFADRLTPRLEAWVKRKTDPKKGNEE